MILYTGAAPVPYAQKDARILLVQQYPPRLIHGLHGNDRNPVCFRQSNYLFPIDQQRLARFNRQRCRANVHHALNRPEPHSRYIEAQILLRLRNLGNYRAAMRQPSAAFDARVQGATQTTLRS